MPYTAQKKITLLCMVCCHDAIWWRRDCENENGSKNMVWKAWSFIMQVWSYKQGWRRNRPSHTTAGQLCAWGLTWFSVSAAEAHIISRAGQDRQVRSYRTGRCWHGGSKRCSHLYLFSAFFCSARPSYLCAKPPCLSLPTTPDQRCPPQPLVQPEMLLLCSAPSEACSAAPSRQLPALFLSEARQIHSYQVRKVNL